MPTVHILNFKPVTHESQRTLIASAIYLCLVHFQPLNGRTISAIIN